MGLGQIVIGIAFLAVAWPLWIARSRGRITQAQWLVFAGLDLVAWLVLQTIVR